MTISARIVLISGLLAASCGGADQPAQQPPAEEATPPVDLPSPPVVEPAPPPTGDTTGKAAPKAPAAPAAPKAPSPKPAFTRTDLEVGTGAIAQKGRRLS